MQFCNFCSKNCESVQNICEEIIFKNDTIVIRNLLNIFRKDIVHFLSDNRNSFICAQCLNQLQKCYEFVQQLKDSEVKLQQGKEITFEHDYFEVAREEQRRNETQLNEKVTVNNKKVDYIETKYNFKPMLPKTSDSELKTKKVLVTEGGKSRLYKCLKCKEAFKSFKALQRHEREYCRISSCKEHHTCKYCHKSFSREDLFREHISVKHAQGEYLCCLCADKSFTGKGYLARHIEKVHQHKSLQYFCGECPELLTLPTIEEIQQHFKQQHPLQEEKTAALSDEDMDLEMHEEFLDEFLLAHTNDNSFQFSECWEALDLHLPDMLNGSSANLNHVEAEFKEAFSCPKCFEQFKNPQPLLKHLAEAHNMPVLICRSCRKPFTSFQDFKKHKMEKCQTYSYTKPMQLDCPYCRKSFAKTLNLKQHLRVVHTQLKRHICQLCDKQFSTLDHLKKHVLSQHQNERKHNCAVCDKSFTQLGHLKQHLAIHTTGKTIQCPECSLKFWRKIDLQRHSKKKHGGVS